MKTNNPSPLVPQGTLPDSRGKSRVQFTMLTIFAVHVVVLGVVLLQGCKRTATDPNAELAALATNYPPPVDSIAPPPTEVAQIPQPTPISIPPPVAQTQPPPVVVAPQEPAPVPPPLPVAPATAASDHVVVKGDSFSVLAKKYGVTTRAISDANPGVDSSRLKIGQKLAIPAPTPRLAIGATGSGSNGNGSEKSYVVKSGDTLFKIAKSYGTTAKALRTANRLRTDQIKVGQKLVIPAKGTPTIESGVGGTAAGATQANPLP